MRCWASLLLSLVAPRLNCAPSDRRSVIRSTALRSIQVLRVARRSTP